MKNKKGFTLIELLAIIVILAIIAVITVPIILNIIDNAKAGSITNSALGYKDAVNKAYVSKLTTETNVQPLNGEMTVAELTAYGVSVSGQEPTDGSLTFTNNFLSSGCLQFDEYKVVFTNGEAGQAEKGTCE